MALILFSWIYSFFILLAMGTLGVALFRIKTQNLFYILISGMFLEMLFLHFTLIFLPTDFIFYLINSFVSILILYQHRQFALEILKKTIEEFNNWSVPIKFSAFIISFSVLAKSAGIPYLVDNESYYIQTIKWLNEYGFVKGLANLHIYFGQMSGWHILQSGLNFGFISNRLNDLNGFLMLIFSFFSLNHFHLYLKKKELTNLYLALILCANLFFFQFVTSPSPDLPVFLISQVIFSLFILNYKKNRGDFNLILVLCIMLILIKITSSIILLFPLILAFRHKIISEKWKIVAAIGIISGILFITKNYIITGYPLYPFNILGKFLTPDWQVPESLQSLYVQITNDSGWKHISPRELKHHNFQDKLIAWTIENKGLELIFNNLFLIILILFPFIAKKEKSFWLIWGIAVINLIMLFLTSPQYRFFFHFMIALSLISFAIISLKNSNLVQGFIMMSILIAFVSLFLNFKIIKVNSQPQPFNSFEAKQIIIPHENSRYKLEFKIIKEGNLKYNTPKEINDFTWGSFDGELPSLNEKHIILIRKKCKVRPQLRTSNLKDGFYSENITE
ncbi:LIC_10190 family membrane protein [Moheibacter sediminis]|uniref:DUF8201 domain-containing protein n=1 Tax=Moheibacter sediminis TaxID=1434700 RepID=A0A1W2BZ36_9FLAO|nr:hypothetical protein [Moheibacter sediminis]SMC78223.1 hypothetical protein SAMN06296427_1088 [Moheibacter sediminis]